MFDKKLLNEAKPFRQHFLRIAFLFSLIAVCTILFAYTLANTTAQVFLGKASFQEVVPLLTVLLLSACGKVALRWHADVVAHDLTLIIQKSLQSRLLQALSLSGPIVISEAKTGELLTCFTEGIEQLDNYFAKFLPQFIAAIIIPLIILCIIIPIDYWSAIIFLFTAPLIPIFMMLIGQRAEAANRQQWLTLTTISNNFLDLLEGLTTLRIFNQSASQKQNIAQMSDCFRVATLKVLRVAFLSAFALELTATLSIAFIAVTVGLRLIDDQIDFKTAFFLLILAPEFYQPLRNLGSSFHTAMTGVAAAQKIFSFIKDSSQPVTDPSNKIALTPMNMTVEFKAVHYAYQTAREKALHGLTFTAPANQHTAILGWSGSGKSTILQLLLGFDRNYQGDILLGGVSIKNIDPQKLRSYSAYLPQSPHIFAMTVAENISIAKPTATLEEIIVAAKQAHIHDVVSNLTQGYATLLGEGGHQLSGGQKQRIAIARAFLKNAPILLLDEPTAALDSKTAQQIDDALALLMQGRTVITITHRIISTAQADHIIVLQDGKTTEEGTYTELLDNHSHLATLQQKRGLL